MEQDKELKAMGEIVAALSDLDDAARSRVIKYVLERIGSNASAGSILPLPIAAPVRVSGERSELGNDQVVDIRTLKDQKKPKSAIQMAILVAYYLKEKAPLAERKDSIDASDIEKYFIQAHFELPAGKNGALDTLGNAKRSGYLESAGGGSYRMNAVGYNLVAFRLGAPNDANGNSKKKASQKKSSRKR